MRLYIDPNYTPIVFNVIRTLQEIQYPKKYEVVSGKWKDEYNAADTSVFLIDYNKKNFNPITLDHLDQGFKVVAYKKKVGESFDPYICALNLLSNWKKILTELESSAKPFILSMGKGNRTFRKISK